MKELVTFFTPTYNRAKIIHRCYESLCSQRSYNFRWLIVDDGSSDQTKELVDKAHSGTLTDEEYHGGTFTVTSLGMYDVDDFVAIINPPEAAILAVGKISRTPVVVTGKDGTEEIAIRPICALNLSYDHRSIDGAEAAKFLQRLKLYLQNPTMML